MTLRVAGRTTYDMPTPTPHTAYWAQRVAERRQSLGLTRSALDAKMGRARGTTWNVEAKRGVGPELRIDLARALDTTVEELFPHELPEPADAA